MAGKPAVVLVHGFWGGAAHWANVIVELKKRGFDDLHAVENPLTSLADDAERTRKMLRQIDGPVVLVGHSYGGAVITEAGDLPNVAALVCIAAFAPDAGESPGQISQEKPPAAFDAIVPDSDGYRELRPGPHARGGAGHGRHAEGAARLDVRRHDHRPRLARQAVLVPGLHRRPHDPPGQRAPHGPAHEPAQDHRTRRRPRLPGLPAGPRHRPHRGRGRRGRRRLTVRQAQPAGLRSTST
ncbi:alpha/beta hydrolase [Streptomyces spectabilis]|uniref:Alpha/beta hydrolase n=1 Tax=Streptomyces spectabilis TaxID=68270 RepID=A0A516RJC5_STRST|nr:alpha/beta hydrolase [Streptomyces spectabilis]